MSNPSQPGFTPVRRREPHNSPAWSPAKAEQASWTASRCNRLLRPITSRVDLLRKRVETRQIISNHIAPISGDVPGDLFKVSSRKRRKQAEDEHRVPSRGQTNDQDPEWLSARDGRRSNRQKYSARSASDLESSVPPRAGPADGGPSEVPGRLTPILARVLTSKPLEERPMDDIREELSDEQRRLRTGPRPKARSIERARKKNQYETMPIESLRGLFIPELWQLYTGLYAAVDALLKACSKSHRAGLVGVPSLLDLCLRKVPHFMELDELWRRESSDDVPRDGWRDDTGLGADLYSELEALHSPNGRGWKPLREIVRAHGIRLISDAAQDGLLPPKVVAALVNLCAAHWAFHEAEALLETLIDIHPPPQRPSSVTSQQFQAESCLALATLTSYVRTAGRRSFQYRQLGLMLRRRQLAPDWLAVKDFEPLLDAVINSLHQQHEDHMDAWLFLEAAIHASMKTDLWDVGTHQSSDPAANFPIPAPSSHKGLRRALDLKLASVMQSLSAIAILGANQTQTRFVLIATYDVQRVTSLLVSITIEIQRILVETKRRSRQGVKDIAPRAAVAVSAALFAALRKGWPPPKDRLIDRNLVWNALRLLAVFTRLPTDWHPTIIPNPSRELKVLECVVESLHAVAYCCGISGCGTTLYFMLMILNGIGALHDLILDTYAWRREYTLLESIVARAFTHPSRFMSQIEWNEGLRTKFFKKTSTSSTTTTMTMTTPPPSRRVTAGLRPMGYKPQVFDADADDEDSAGAWEDELCKHLANTPAISSRGRRKESISSSSSEDGTPARGRINFTKHISQIPKLSEMLLGESPRHDHTSTSHALPAPPGTVRARGREPRKKRGETPPGLRRSPPPVLGDDGVTDPDELSNDDDDDGASDHRAAHEGPRLSGVSGVTGSSRSEGSSFVGGSVLPTGQIIYPASTTSSWPTRTFQDLATDFDYGPRSTTFQQAPPPPQQRSSAQTRSSSSTQARRVLSSIYSRSRLRFGGAAPPPPPSRRRRPRPRPPRGSQRLPSPPPQQQQHRPSRPNRYGEGDFYPEPDEDEDEDGDESESDSDSC